jgi:hypothetical protein
MTTLYSYQGQEPQELPDRILLSDGRKRTDVSTFTEEEIEDAGFTGPYTIPSIDIESQIRRWDSQSLKYVVEDIPEEELWKKFREERNRRLSETDWVMSSDIRNAPNNEPIRKWELYRQRLRDLTSITENPKFVLWPPLPLEDAEFDLETTERADHNSIRYRLVDLENKVDEIYNKLFPKEYIPDPN